jgi:hypothetical protein
VNESENHQFRLAVGRLMGGQREALRVIRQALEDEDGPTEDVLVDLEDILEGSSADASAILGKDEEMDEEGES